MALISDLDENPIDILINLPQFQGATAEGKLNLLSGYETELRNIAEERHPAGWEGYKSENRDYIDYLEGQQSDVFQNEMTRLEEKRSQWLGDYWRQREGAGGPLRAAMTIIGEDVWQGIGWTAQALGYEETAREAIKNRDKIVAGYSLIANETARIANELDDSLLITNELFNFASNFFPALRPDDKQLIASIMKKEGITNEQGLLVQALNPYNIAGMLGHFGRIRTIMSALSGSFPAMFASGAPTASLASRGGYSALYAVSAGISDALEVPIAEQSMGRLAGIMGGTYSAMLAGTSLSAWAMKQPIVAAVINRLPSALQAFTAGRISDIGESISNSVEVAIREGNPWEAIKAFPAALIANMIEEIIIDLPGIPGTLSRTGAWQLKQHQIENLSQIESGIEVKMQTAKEKDRKTLARTLNNLRKAKERRTTQFKDLIKKEIKREDSIFNRNREEITSIANDLIKEQGYTKEGAFEEAVSQFYLGQAEIEGTIKNAVEIIDKQEQKKLGVLAKAGETALGLIGREAPGREEQRAEIRAQAEEAIIGAERAEEIEVEVEAEIAEIEKKPVEEIVPEPKPEVKPKITKKAAKQEIKEIETELRKTVADLTKTRIETPGEKGLISDLEKAVKVLTARAQEAGAELPLTDKEVSQLKKLGYSRKQINQFKLSTSRQKIKEQKKFKKAAKKVTLLSSYILKNIGGLDIEGLQEIGYDPVALKENVRNKALLKSGIGGANQVERAAESLQEDGIIPPDIDNPMEFMIEKLTEEGFRDISVEELRGEKAEEKIEKAEQQEELRQLGILVTEGEITEAQYEKAVAKILGEKPEFYRFAIGKKGETGIDGIALQTVGNLMKTDPRLRNFVTVNELGRIEVNLKDFKEETGRDYAGEPIAGLTKIYIDGTAAIEVANDATKMVAHQEWWNFLYNTIISDEDRFLVDSRYDLPVEAAEGFARWAVTEEKGNFLAKTFKKIKAFLDRVWNALKGKGFTSVEDIFAKGYYNPGVFLDRNALNDSTFLTPEGTVIVENHKDYEEAYQKNWVRKELQSDNLSYSVKELNAETLTQIEKDLAEFDTKTASNQAIMIEDQNRYYIFDTDTYFFDNDIDKTLNESLKRDKKKVSKTIYAIEDLPDPEKESSLYSDIKNIVKLPKDVYAKFTEFVKFNRESRKDEYGAKDPINSFEVWTALPAFLKKKSKHLRTMIELEYRRERRRKVMVRLFNRRMKPYTKLTYAEMQAANELLVKGDRAGRDLKDNEFKGYSKEAADGYKAVRKTMDLIAKFEISYIAKKIQEIRQQLKEGDFLSKTIEGELEATLGVLGASINRWKQNVGKGYIPHVWQDDAKWEIVFGVSADAEDFNYITPEQQERLLQALKGMSGVMDEWVDRSKKDFEASGRVTYRLHYKETDDYKNDRAILEAIGIKPTAKPYDNTKAEFDLDVTRVELRNMFDAILDKTREAGKKGGKEESVIQALDLLEKNVNVWELTTGWRAAEIKKAGTYGYEIDDIAGVLQRYITGYAGLATKRDLSQRLFQEYANIPIENKNERKINENFINNVLHNNNKSDRIQAQLLGWLYHKYIAFNIPFHIRNRFQPWYLGVPVLADTLGAKRLPRIGREMMRAQLDIRNLELWLATNDLTIDKQRDLVNHIHTMDENDQKALFYALRKGLLDEQFPDEWRDLRIKTLNQSTLSKKIGLVSKILDRWVTLSDAKNRLQVYLAGVRLGMSFEDALEASRKANVVYKRWNVPGFLSSEFGRKVRFLFPFQKYQWHTLEMMVRWGIKGLIGPTLFYWLFSALFGGKDSVPFFRAIKGLLGVPTATKARERLIRAIGGNKKLMEIWDTGLIGALPVMGVDMSTSFKVRLSVFDPLIGNIWASEIKGFKRSYDSIRRGRWIKAIGEDNPTMPRYASKIFRAYRQATEGITTYKGDVVLNVSGAPLKMSTLDIMKVSMGFLPVRLGKHYKARRDARALKEHFSIEKSRIGTKYKVAVNAGDRDELRNVKRLVEDFNKRVNRYAIGGTLPVGEINDGSLRNFRRAADTKKIREIMKELYVF